MLHKDMYAIHKDMYAIQREQESKFKKWEL